MSTAAGIAAEFCIERAIDLELQILRHMEAKLKEALDAHRERCAEIAFREVWVRSGGVAARNVAKAIRAGHTDITDDMMVGATREEPI